MSDQDDLDQLHVNSEYAAAYLKTKRQELAKTKSARCASKATESADATDSDVSSSSSEDEDPDGLLLTPNLDRQIMRTIERIRARDPAVYKPDAKFYDDDDNAENVNDRTDQPEATKPPKAKKPKSVRQVLAEQMIEEALNPEADPDKVQYVPANEQALARRAFLTADQNASDSDDDLELIPRSRQEPDDGGEYAQFAAAQDRCQQRAAQAVSANALGRYARAEGLSAEDLFLKEFVAGEWWKEQRPAGYIDRGLIAAMRPEQIADQHDGADLSADEAFLEAQDNFEAQYNFRFEEPGGKQIVTHPRNIENSVRREDDRRARRREKRKAAKNAAKERQVEELRRAKNLRKQELLAQAEKEELQKVQEMRQKQAQERLDALTEFAGVQIGDDEKRTALLSQLDLDGEFDAAEYDRKMAAVFDDQFYDDDEAGEDLFVKNANESQAEGCHEDAENTSEQKSSKKKRAKISSEKTSQILDELYAMDFEDTIAGGDLKTRFRYTQVPAHSFGMSVDDILNTDDKELQRRVSIKQLAPYRTDRNLKMTWQQLHKDRSARFRRKQARAGQQPQKPS